MYNNLNKLSIQEYDLMTKKSSKNSNVFKHCILAFLFGGSICLIAKFFYDIITGRIFEGVSIDVGNDTAKTITTVFMVFIGVLLTALNVYDEIGNIAGAGTVVPITGFANSITSPAMEYKSEGYILGVGSQMFQVAGPVLVYGCVASVLVGLAYYFLG